MFNEELKGKIKDEGNVMTNQPCVFAAQRIQDILWMLDVSGWGHLVEVGCSK